MFDDAGEHDFCLGCCVILRRLAASWQTRLARAANVQGTCVPEMASYAATMYERVRSLLMAVDRLIAPTSLVFGREDGVLLSFLFHSLFLDRKEARSGVMDPQQGITVEIFRAFIEHFQKHGYIFVSASDIARGLRSKGRYVLLTFDDGYYNNTRALPLLAEFNVPAVFFVSTGHVKEGKAFWWDAAHREMRRRGVAQDKIDRRFSELKRLKTADVEAWVEKEFGASALAPLGDLDRPFTPSELRDFARHPLVSLGNHTCDHAILSNYSEAEVCAQILRAQGDILAMTGQSAEMIAYPNGYETPAIVAAARHAGLGFGVGVNPGPNRLPLHAGSNEAMMLKRFTLNADVPIESQCRMSRSGVSLYRSARAMRKNMRANVSSSRPS
jgi:peptidoglycan/xylan/chitin deacetylase (PgdA/CDA1 family)